MCRVLFPGRTWVTMGRRHWAGVEPAVLGLREGRAAAKTGAAARGSTGHGRPVV